MVKTGEYGTCDNAGPEIALLITGEGENVLTLTPAAGRTWTVAEYSDEVTDVMIPRRRERHRSGRQAGCPEDLLCRSRPYLAAPDKDVYRAFKENCFSSECCSGEKYFPRNGTEGNP